MGREQGQVRDPTRKGTQEYAASGDSVKIEKEIDETRRHMDNTMEELSQELGQWLNPHHLLDEALGIVRNSGTREEATERAKDVGARVARGLRENPIPSALIGAGIAWFIFNETQDEEDQGDEMDELEKGERHRVSSRTRRRSRSSRILDRFRHDGDAGGSESFQRETYPSGTNRRSIRQAESYYSAEPLHEASGNGWSGDRGKGSENTREAFEEYGGKASRKAKRAYDEYRSKASGKAKQSFEEYGGRARETFGEYEGRAKETAQEARERLEHTGHEAAERVRSAGRDFAEGSERKYRHWREDAEDAYGRFRERAGEVGERAANESRESLEEAGEWIMRMAKEHPLAAGLSALAIGLLAGSVFPESRKEREWMGDYSEEARERAKQKGREAYEKAYSAGRHVAESATSAAGQAIREETGKVSEQQSESGEEEKELQESASHARPL